MVYYDEGIFKRYVKKIKNKNPNSEKPFREVQQLNITGLSKNSKFEDGQKIVIMDYDDFLSLQDGVTTAPESTNNLKVIELYEKLEQKQNTIDKYNNIFINTNDRVNTLIDDLANEVTTYISTGINQSNSETQSNIRKLLDEVKEVNKANLLVMEEVQKQVNQHNTNYDNSNKIKKFFMSKINIDFENLEDKTAKINEFNQIDIEDKAKTITNKFTIDNAKISEIKNNTKSKKIGFNELETSPDDKTIIVNDAGKDK